MAPSQLAIVLLLASHSRILAFVCIPIYERYFGSQTKPLRVPLHASSSDDSSSEPSQNLNVRVYDNVFSSEACDSIHGMWHNATSYVVQYSSLTMAGCRSIQSSSSSQLSERVKMSTEWKNCKTLQIRMLGSYKHEVALRQK